MTMSCPKCPPFTVTKMFSISLFLFLERRDWSQHNTKRCFVVVYKFKELHTYCVFDKAVNLARWNFILKRDQHFLDACRIWRLFHYKLLYFLKNNIEVWVHKFYTIHFLMCVYFLSILPSKYENYLSLPLL